MSKSGGNSKTTTNPNSQDAGESITTKKQSKNRGKKRRRQASDSSSEFEDVLPENTLEMEKNLHASAMKNNLDDVSVRKILKKVVTNDHVLALVKLREEEEDSGPEENSLRPKLTRAKVKELMKGSPKAAAWDLNNLELTPIKHIPVKTRPEVKALIAQELPEDEDDDEYEPTHDDVPSDDEQTLESCSDADSQPRTPATPRAPRSASPRPLHDGPFKVPQDVPTPTRRKLNLEEEATIALRTRSKLSLSATSIEHIESTFVPPDEPPLPAVDDLWSRFLADCLEPDVDLAAAARPEDDDDADPEYNVAADPDAHDEDEEALGNSIIKISKKELNDLVTELFNIMPEVSAEDELADNLANSVLTDHSQTDINATRWEGKQEPLSDDEKRERLVDKITFEKKSYTRFSIGKTETEQPQNTKAQKASAKGTATTSAVPPVANENDRSAVASEKNGSALRNIREPVNQKDSNTAGAGSVSISIEEQEEAAVPARAPPLLRRLQQRRPPRAQRLRIQIEPAATQVLPEQILILQQQIRQHVQLATTNYLQLYIHPMHWSYGPAYKEYLETLTKLVEKNPNSVVNVCNLKPAMELVETWEKTVSANTPENTEMVEFIQSEAERCRRRTRNNNLYVGEFHETFKRVVSNSVVILYPHLLPAMPYRADTTARRYSYLRSEDELIALGLDQFWQYVEDNPALYTRRRYPQPQRSGLASAAQLVAKHMLPWIPVRVLLGHIKHVRKHGDKDNPICKFFENREVKPVQHRLLAFNPQMTLFEQPEQELPRLWIRYLAKTSKRFRSFLHRRTNVTGIAPTGVPVEMGKAVAEPTKAPLPIEFTKQIVSNRANVKIHPPKPQLADKFDVEIGPTDMQAPVLANVQLNNQELVANVRLANQSEGHPLAAVTAVSTAPQPDRLVATNMFKVVRTDTGMFLVPLTDVSTVNTNIAPITTPMVTPTATNPKETLSLEHCNCCVLLTKICKRQTVITEYFKPNISVKKSCYCKNVKYPRISNKLRLLLNTYRNKSQCNLRSLEKMLNMKYGKKCDNINEKDEVESNSTEDIEYVTSFQLRLLTRVGIARNTYMKKRLNTLFSKFDIDYQDPTALAKELYKACEVELVDMYKEFLGFLTPEQADRMDVFKDYFVRTPAEELMKKINEQVQDKEARHHMLSHLHAAFQDNVSTACEMCTSLLQPMVKYPKLAEYVFSLFPHRRDKSKEKVTPPVPESAQESCDGDMAVDTDTHAAMDYEADDSSSGEETESATVQSAPNHNHPKSFQPTFTAEPASETAAENHQMATDTIKTENDCDHDSSSNASMLIVFEDESVKPEGREWNREEDKLILEVLKEHLTPEERKDKTILEILTEKNVFEIISQSLTHKSLDDVNNRVLYLLQLLVLSEKN